MSLSLEHAKEARIMKKKEKLSILTRVTGHLWISCHRFWSTQERSENVCKQMKKKRRRKGSGCARDKRTERWFSATSAGVVAIPLHTNKNTYIYTFLYTHTYLHIRIRMYDLYFVVYSFFLLFF